GGGVPGNNCTKGQYGQSRNTFQTSGSANALIVLKYNRRSEFKVCKNEHMKRSIVLTVVAALSQTIAVFAGPEPKQVVAPPPPPPPEYFRPNEFDIGAFATWAIFNGINRSNGTPHAWGGGMDFTYWFPWKYAGVRFQGTGMSIHSGTGHTHRTVNILGQPETINFGGGSVAAGMINADVLLRLPLDDFWPGVHLAP